MDSLYSRYLSLVQTEPQAREAATDFVESVADRELIGLIGLCLEDPLWFSLAFLRVVEAGATPVIMPTDAEQEEFGIGRVIDGRGLRCSQPQGPPLKAESGTFYGFSSGSTGQRRPVALSCQRAMGNARAHAASLGVDDASLVVQTLRIHHSFGVVAYVFTPLQTGARVATGVFFDSLFSPKRQLDMAHHLVHLTPYHVQFLMRRRVKPGSPIGKLTVGAGPLRRAEALYAASLCRELYTTYGLTEAGPRVTTGLVDPATFVDGWIGHPLHGVEARVDDQGALWLRTPYACVDAVVGEYFSTGDCVECGDDGSWVFKNRQNDVLRIRGQTYVRSAYSQKLCDLVQLPCEVGQVDYSDDLLVFIESERPDEAVVQKIHLHLPELREARVVWCRHFERTVLGKTDIRRMLLGAAGGSG